jgi:uncharacterized protein
LAEIMANLLLQGVVGSTAYNMATPQSDIDHLGVAAVDTIELVGLHTIKQTYERHDPDTVIHEAGKFCSLALKCNPMITELLWLHSYEFIHPLGQELIEIRHAFLSEKLARNAYFGYASQQFRRITGRGDNSFSADTRNRTAKHARHLMRLLLQGTDLYKTGRLEVVLDDETVEDIFEFGDLVAQGDLDIARLMLKTAEEGMDAGPCALPKYPNEKLAAEWLQEVRRAFW